MTPKKKKKWGTGNGPFRSGFMGLRAGAVLLKGLCSALGELSSHTEAMHLAGLCICTFHGGIQTSRLLGVMCSQEESILIGRQE